MSSSALPLADASHRLWADRARGLFAGFGYATSVTLLLISIWAAEAALVDLLQQRPLGMWQDFAAVLRVEAIATFPALPPLVLILNRAPQSGLSRIAWLLAAASVMALWCNVCIRPEGGSQTPVADFLDSLLTAALVVAACAYNRSARTGTGALLRRRIEDATLDAELKRARLQLLRAQVEPHFLFNTLATVRRLGRIDRLVAVEMLDNLVHYFSAALPALRQEDIALGEEAKLIDAYLRIHQIRMGRRLSYDVTVPEDLGRVRIPSMIVLTLVENSLKHGITPSVEGGAIRVRAMQHGSCLVLIVADSGRGMTAWQGHGTGLANARRRLMLAYGDGATLSLARGEPRGVVATISIPLGNRA